MANFPFLTPDAIQRLLWNVHDDVDQRNFDELDIRIQMRITRWVRDACRPYYEGAWVGSERFWRVVYTLAKKYRISRGMDIWEDYPQPAPPAATE